MGVAETFVQAARRQACLSLGGLPKGACTAAVLHFGADGRPSDPAVRLRLEVINSWLQLWSPLSTFDRDATRSVWRAILCEPRPRPWSRARGPITAAIATLRWAGWVPLDPDRWREPPPRGDLGIVDDELVTSRKLVLTRIERSIQIRLWARAPLHSDGAGLGQGDYTPAP